MAASPPAAPAAQPTPARRAFGLVLAAAAWIASGCDAGPPPPGAVRLAILGDSLTAGLGLAPEQAYPALVESALRRRGWTIDVVNAGRSGDTTADGLARLDALLDRRPDAVLVALGGNDGLAGRSLVHMEANLGRIVEGCRARGARVGLVGVRLPLVVQRDARDPFGEVYRRVAARYDVTLLPDILAGVAGVPGMMQPDRIHPTAEGQRVMAGTVVEHLLATSLLR